MIWNTNLFSFPQAGQIMLHSIFRRRSKIFRTTGFLKMWEKWEIGGKKQVK